MSAEKVRDGLCCVAKCRGEATITIYDMDLCEEHKSRWYKLVDWRIEPQPFSLKRGWDYPDGQAKDKAGNRIHYQPVDEAARKGWSVPPSSPKAKPPEVQQPEAVDPAKLRKKRVKKGDTQSQIFGSEEAA